MAAGLSHERVFSLVRAIPRGRVATYGQLARLVGHPRAARQIGYALHRCPSGLPWHRVVNARGQVSLPSDSTAGMTQRRRLREEGVEFIAGRIDLARYGWHSVCDVKSR